MGVCGVILPPEGYFKRIGEILRRYDILLIVDEVITGFGRLGRMFGSQIYGLAPDILTCAKGMSSGYLPISAVMISEPIWDVCLRQSDKIGVFGHGFTYSGHPVSAAVALEVLKLYDELDIAGNLEINAPLLQNGLRRLAEHPLVGDARGAGYMGALELVKDKATKAPFSSAAAVGLFAERRCLSHGVIVRALGDAIAVAPPLIANASDIEAILAAITLALDETYAYAIQNGFI